MVSCDGFEKWNRQHMVNSDDFSWMNELRGAMACLVGISCETHGARPWKYKILEIIYIILECVCK